MSMIDHAIITRAEARERDLPRYYTGIPCINGHLSERLTRGKMCLACHRETQARTRAADPERIARIKAASYLRHRVEVLAKVQTYQANNADKIRARKRAFREAHRADIAEYMATWAKANRQLLRVHERRRRDRHRAAKLVGRHTLAEVRVLLTRQNGLCANNLCSVALVVEPGPLRFHEDHILAITLGGTDDISNIQLLCPTCNLRKGDLSPEEWEARRHDFVP